MDWFARRPRTPPQALQPPPPQSAAAAARRKRAAAAPKPRPRAAAAANARPGPATKTPRAPAKPRAKALPPCKEGKARPRSPGGTVTGRCVKVAQSTDQQLTAATRARIIALADAQMRQVQSLPWHKRIFTMKNMIMATVAVLGAAAAVIYFNRWRRAGLQGVETVYKYWRKWKYPNLPSATLTNISKTQKAAQAKMVSLAGTFKDPRLSDSKNVKTFLAAVREALSHKTAPSADDMAKLQSIGNGLVSKPKYGTNETVGKILQTVCAFHAKKGNDGVNAGQCYPRLGTF